ncbi:threonine ammonia-lyase IlvA [Lacticaseibacillus sp. GG6-2]
MAVEKQELTQADVEKASGVLAPIIRHTPLQYDSYLSQKYQAKVYLKREDLQEVRSFKIRGAYFAVSQTTEEERARGVVCASAGNHAQGIAWTSRKMGIHATIFMPVPTPKQKHDQVEFFGGDNITIKMVGDTFDQCAAAAMKFCEEENQTFIAPFEDFNTMAGQGTIATEIFQDAKEQNFDVDYLCVAIGGGGLVSGVSTYTKGVSPQTTVVGVEPASAASMAAAFKAGHPVTLDSMDTFVDGCAVGRVGDLTYKTARKHVDVLTQVPEGAVSQTLLDMYTKEAIVAEPAGALSVSALDNLKDEIVGKTVVCIVSGGNNDINRMQEIEERALVYAGLQHYFIFNFPQRPGALREFVSKVLGPDDDITKFEYTKRASHGEGPVLVGILLGDKSTYSELVSRMEKFDPRYINLIDNPMLYNMLV